MWAGTAKIVRVLSTPGGTRIILRRPFDDETHLDVEEQPEKGVVSGLVARGVHPLAVQIKTTGSSVACSLVATGTAGSFRLPVTLAAALGACEAGIHGVVIRVDAVPNPGSTPERVGDAAERVADNGSRRGIAARC